MRNQKLKEEYDLGHSIVNIRFKTDLIELKDRFLASFEKMLSADLEVEEDYQSAVAFTKSLKKGLKKIIKTHLNSKSKMPSKALKPFVTEIRNLNPSQTNPESFTCMALKNPTSFMIATFGQRLTLVENNAQVYSEDLPSTNLLYGQSPETFTFAMNQHSLLLTDMVYVGFLDSYFMAYDSQLFMKRIDWKPPSLFMSLNCGMRMGASLRFSEANQRLIVTRDDQFISVLNLETKEIEIDVSKQHGDQIWDFRIFGGAEEDQVVALTLDGLLIL